MTAADIQSCLYYVHVDSTDDVCVEDDRSGESSPVRQSEGIDSERRGSSDERNVPVRGSEVRRKPVPDRRENDKPYRHPPDHRSGVHAAQIGQISVAQDVKSTPTISNRSFGPSTPHPNGPRSMQHRHVLGDGIYREGNSGERNSDPRGLSGQSPISPPRLPLSVVDRVENCNYGYEVPNLKAVPQPSTRNDGAEFSHQANLISGRTSYTNKLISTKDPTTRRDMSLTLIRRHAGSQWNVAKIWRSGKATNSQQIAALNNPSRFDQASSDLYIDILTPGYQRFTSTLCGNGISQSPTTRPSDPAAEFEHSPDSFAQEQEKIKHFRRYIHTTESKPERPGKRHKEASRSSNSSSSSSLLPFSPSNNKNKHANGFRSSFDFQRRMRRNKEKSYEGENGNISVDSPHRYPTNPNPNNSHNDDDISTTTTTTINNNPPNQNHTNTYTFQTPWKNSTCEFSFFSSSSGLGLGLGLGNNRSLLCKHFVAIPNPNPHLHPHPHSHFYLPSSGSLISELRPNLPSSSSSSSFSNHPLAPSKDFENENKNETIPEGGGGSSGKKAKLGKLIISNEGLDMLDLVVGGNIAIFFWVGIFV